MQLRHDHEQQRLAPVERQQHRPAAQPQRVLRHAVAPGAAPVPPQPPEPREEHRHQHPHRLERMQQVAPQVVGVAAETVGARHVLRTMPVAMVVGHVRGPEHEGRVALQQRDPEIGQPVHAPPAPHAQVHVVVVDHADAEREEQHQRIQHRLKPCTHCHAASAGSADEVGQALPVAPMAQPRQAKARVRRWSCAMLLGLLSVAAFRERPGKAARPRRPRCGCGTAGP
jgi:hypothetical protein